MNKIVVIAFFGASGSGKDLALQVLEEILRLSNHDVNIMISATTRPPRDYEVDGEDYYFYSVEEFTKQVLNGEMLEATEKNWFYGTPIKALKENHINIGVLNPEGIECLMADSRLLVIPIWIQTSDKIRLLRSLAREESPDCDEIIRRYGTDKKDFENIEFKYIPIDNNEVGLENLKNSLIVILGNLDQEGII